jgi:hypothetical protein
MATLSSVIPPVNISSASGTLPAANGGTGLTSPGTAGNVLSSNGTTWTSAAPVSSSGQITAVASGALSDGTKVIVNSDGTVSAVAPRGGPSMVGPEYIFRNANTSTIATSYNAATQTVVIAYRDDTASGVGRAIVGTVSGTAITFGSPVTFSGVDALFGAIAMTYDSVGQKTVIFYVVFDSGAGVRYIYSVVGTVSGTSISFGSRATVISSSWTLGLGINGATYDSNTQRVVVVYSAGISSVTGTASVGTVSGTSISFGSGVTFATNTIERSCVYDVASQKVVVAYRNDSNSLFGTATVGTVSGTTISFGTAVVFNSATTSSPALIYDPNTQKTIIAWSSSTVSSAIVGTVSGTSISFGTAASFVATTSASNLVGTYDANAQRVVLAYTVGGTGFGGTSVGTVSGTSISFGSMVTFNAASTDAIGIAYSANATDSVIVFRDVGNSNQGTSVVFQVSGSNLTNQNFIGISNGVYSNGQTATIQTVGSTDDAQTGLTAGRLYYVLSNGSLSLTAGSPSVVAGTAISATKLIIKG